MCILHAQCVSIQTGFLASAQRQCSFHAWGHSRGHSPEARSLPVATSSATSRPAPALRAHLRWTPWLLIRLQSVLNTAARPIVSKAESDRIGFLLKPLPWLPMALSTRRSLQKGLQASRKAAPGAPLLPGALLTPLQSTLLSLLLLPLPGRSCPQPPSWLSPGPDTLASTLTSSPLSRPRQGQLLRGACPDHLTSHCSPPSPLDPGPTEHMTPSDILTPFPWVLCLLFLICLSQLYSKQGSHRNLRHLLVCLSASPNTKNRRLAQSRHTRNICLINENE